jgi:flagellar hook assembly protein FlgD
VASFALHQNVPNPFNPSTLIEYDVERNAVQVEIIICDVTGRTVRTLVRRQHPAGRFQASWDGRDNHGRSAVSGVYFYRMISGEFTQTRKMVLLK